MKRMKFNSRCIWMPYDNQYDWMFPPNFNEGSRYITMIYQSSNAFIYGKVMDSIWQFKVDQDLDYEGRLFWSRQYAHWRQRKLKVFFESDFMVEISVRNYYCWLDWTTKRLGRRARQLYALEKPA